MQIQIDLSLLNELEISADEYIYLYLTWRKGQAIIEKFNGLQYVERNVLQDKGLLKIMDKEDWKSDTIRQKFIDFFSGDFDRMWAELISTYPIKVRTSGGGYRVLHAADPDAKSNEKAKKRYHKIVGTKKHRHDEIMKLLHIQLKAERGRLEFLQKLDTWVNQQTWENYIELGSDGNNNTAGEGIRVTRKLG